MRNLPFTPNHHSLRHKKIENVLRRHGVEDEPTESRKSPRTTAQVNAIIEDVQKIDEE